MKQRRQQRQASIDKLFELVKSPKYDEEIVAHWCKYLCVLASGHIEESIREILSEVASSKRCPRAISQYVSNSVGFFRNAEHSKVIELLKRFDPKWADAVASLDDEIRSSVNSIVNNRHQIAHGGPATFSRSQLEKWFTDSKLFIAKVEEACN